MIDPRPYQAQFDSAKANLAQAKANLELAKIEFQRYAGLIGTKAISQQDYDTKKSTVDVDEAQVQAAQAAVEKAKLNLDYCFIHSPIEGRAGARLVDVGNVVQANTTALLLIQRLDPIYADFTITERDLPEVQEEMKRGSSKRRSGCLRTRRPARGSAADISRQRGAERNWHRQLAGDDPQRRPPFLAGAVCEREAGAATQKGAVLVPSQATQISQKGPLCVRRKTGRDGGLAAGHAGAATGQ